MNADAVVVGGGIAGLVTALRLAEKGGRPLVLEKGREDRYPCNTRMAGGAFHVAHRDVADDPQVIRDAIARRTGDSARPEIIDTLAREIGPATQWLRSKGVRFIKVGHEPYRKHTLAPPIATHGVRYWEGRGGDALLRTLLAELERSGGQFMRGSRAEQLILRDGACVGLRATRDGKPLEIAARAVVICDGGFQSNRELLREFITPAPERLMQRNAGAGQGDGLCMAREAGAKLVGMERFYGHVLAQDAMRLETLSPFPMMDLTCSAGIVVDPSGRRFMDESLGGVTMANTIAAQADPLGTVAIFDEAIWNGPGREYLIPANPILMKNGGTLFSAANLRELAAATGLPAAGLETTVAAYNQAVDGQRLGELMPPRNGGGHRAWPIRLAPFHAVRLCAGITYTMGGIAIDADARVLARDDRPITGLYAAGCATGGVEGGGMLPEVAYIGGLTRSTVFALRAADHIARERAAA